MEELTGHHRHRLEVLGDVQWMQGRQSWGLGSRPPDFVQGVVGGLPGGHSGSWTGRKIWPIIISYHVQQVCLKVVTFEEK